jgi:hypothetical protein
VGEFLSGVIDEEIILHNVWNANTLRLLLY